ncbi:MAG TPA: hypothetical protein VFI86_04045 [Burkholderiales bacterium]|nr:hypothetical protein [Burkholderiales bacterium]
MTGRGEIPLVRDVLDAQVFDREKRAMGRVDGIALELREGAPPRVAYLEIDGAAAWRRLGERFGRWARRLQRLWDGGPYRFRWAQVRELSIHLELDVDAERTPAFALERWLREKM